MAMAKYRNSEILAAVLNRWASPLVDQLVAANISAIPFVGNIESKIKSTGWVSQNWSLALELAPLMGNAAEYIIEPLLSQYLANVPEQAIPKVAHGIVDNAIASGSDVRLFEGRVRLTRSDLEDLKKLLQYNLPLNTSQGYEVITNPKNEAK